jgi:hypothetical protein
VKVEVKGTLCWGGSKSTVMLGNSKVSPSRPDHKDSKRMETLDGL